MPIYGVYIKKERKKIICELLHSEFSSQAKTKIEISLSQYDKQKKITYHKKSFKALMINKASHMKK